MIAACGDTAADDDDDIGNDAAAGAPAALSIAPPTQRFGSVLAGESSTAASFTVTNHGDGATDSLGVSIAGASASQFAVVADGCVGTALAGAGTCTIDVRFEPDAIGNFSATLNVTGGAGASASATLRGEGIEPGRLSITPTPQSFGEVLIGATSPGVTFVVANTGGAETGELAAGLDGGDTSQFALAADGCSGTSLAGGEVCTITARFEPTSAGPKASSLRVAADPGGTVTAAIEGTGLDDARLVVNPTEVDFGSVLGSWCSSPVRVTVTVTNVGDVRSGSVAATLAGTDASQFRVDADTCSGRTLDSGASCSLQVAFVPTSAGAKAAQLDVAAAPGDTATTTLSGTSLSGSSVLVITPTPANFGVVAIGDTSAPILFMVTNASACPEGPLALTLAGPNPDDFAIVPGTDGCTGRTLEPGEACTLTAEFTPKAMGGRSAALTVASPRFMLSAYLAGSGNHEVFDMAPASFDFGSTCTGATAGPVTFTVTNAGGLPSATLTTSVSGDISQFVILDDGCTGTALAPGGTCTIDVRFEPTTLGTKSAQLEVSAMPGGIALAPLTGDAVICP